MINVTIHTDGDPKAIEPDSIEEILVAHGFDVWRVEVVHLERGAHSWGSLSCE